MKIIVRTSCILLIAVFFVLQLYSQNVGIGAASPDFRLHVLVADSSILKLENSTAHNINVKANLLFKSGDRYTGAVKTIGTSNVDARLAFFTYASQTTSLLKERMSILDDGKVGIGTSTPDYMLTLINSGSSLLKIENAATLATNVVADQFFKTGAYYTGAVKTIGTSASTARLGLFTLASVGSGSLLERISILNNGNVGIGIADPLAKLHVNGTLRIADGSQGTGKVLTSDASGNASWMNPPLDNNERFLLMYSFSGTTAPNQFQLGYEISSDITINLATGLVTINKTGLYHFEVGADVQLSVGADYSQQSTIPELFRAEMQVTASGGNYNEDFALIKTPFLREFNTSNMQGIGKGSMEIYLAAPATVKIVYGASTAGRTFNSNAMGENYFSGYLISE